MKDQQGRDEEDLREIWSGFYEFLLEEHERRLESASALGVSPGDLKAMLRLEPGNPQPMHALAVTWRCDASTVTWIVDRLEKRGLVERQPHPTDRRVKAVALSAEGEELRGRLIATLFEPPAVMRTLSEPDRRLLRRVVDQLKP